MMRLLRLLPRLSGMVFGVAVMLPVMPQARAEGLEDPEMFGVWASGSVAYYAGTMQGKPAGGSGRLMLRSEIEINADAEGSTESGLGYGFHLSQIRESEGEFYENGSYLFLSGNLGRIQLGPADGAATTLWVGPPVVGMGQVDGKAYLFDVPVAGLSARDSDNAPKITYLTPVFQGFQAGISYAPRDLSVVNVELDDDTLEELAANAFNERSWFYRDSMAFRDVVEVSARYQGAIGPFTVAASAAYVSAQALDTEMSSWGDNGLEPFASARRSDLHAWSAGGRLSFEGFSAGGAFFSDGSGGSVLGVTSEMPVSGEAAILSPEPGRARSSGWSAGAAYQSDTWAVGASFARCEFGSSNTKVMSIGAEALLAEGLRVQADLTRWSSDQGFDGKATGTLAVIGVRLDF
jgi:predicted porin